MKRIKTFLEYLTAFTIIVLLLFTIASVVVIKFYGDEVKSYAMTFVNDQLETEINIDEIGISIFRKFPNTSIYFKNVYINSGTQYNKDQFKKSETDTLLFADFIYLKFNLSDLLRKKFQINSMELNNGMVNILIDAKGEGNYIFGTDTIKKSSDVFIDVKKLKLINTNVKYVNQAKQTKGEIFLKEIDLNGNFSKKKFNLNASLKGNIDHFENQQVNYITDAGFSADISVDVDQKQYSITTGKLNLGDLQALLQGTININDNNHPDLDLKFEGRRVDIAWLEEFLSLREDYKNNISGEGLLELKGSIRGIISPLESPNIFIAFSTDNSTLNIKNRPDYKIQSISFRGSYTNGAQNKMESSSVVIDQFEAIILNSDITGSFVITNLIQPHFKLMVRGNLEVTDWIEILPDHPVTFMNGTVAPNLIIKGEISGLTSENRKISYQPTGELKFENIKAETAFNDKPLQLNNIAGNLNILNNNQWNANIKGFLETFRFNSTINITHPIQKIQNKEIIEISGNIFSNYINIEEAIETFSPSQKSSEIRYPEKIILDFDFKFDTISHKNITAKNFKGSLKYKFPHITISPFAFQTMNGSANGSLQLTRINSVKQQLEIATNYQNIDIHNLFISMNEFGQDFITSENIAGQLSGNTAFSTSLNKGSKMKASDVTAESKISINDGELINFMPVIEMYKFLDIPNPEYIKFSEITNTLLIQDNKLIIPEMQINSSAINLLASGTHHFDKLFDYHLAIRLSEYLYKRSRISNNSEFEIALDEEDTRTIFLVLRDHGNGLKIAFDEEQTIKKVRQDLKKEKQELKEIFRNEFRSGEISGKDQDTMKNKDPSELRFEFPNSTTEDTLKQKRTTRKKWWKKEDTSNKNSEFQFIIEDNY